MLGWLWCRHIFEVSVVASIVFDAAKDYYDGTAGHDGAHLQFKIYILFCEGGVHGFLQWMISRGFFIVTKELDCDLGYAIKSGNCIEELNHDYDYTAFYHVASDIINISIDLSLA